MAATYARPALAEPGLMGQIEMMAARVSPLPSRGVTFFDARDGDRTLRVSWRPEAGLFVLSTWRGDQCVSTFQLAKDDLPDLLSNLVALLVPQDDAAATTATA
jgi:hypothetical protein